MIKNVFILSLCSVFLTACYKKPPDENIDISKIHAQYVNESTKKINDTFGSNNDYQTFDNDILSARKYISDYDSRLKNAQEYIENCVKGKSSNDLAQVIEKCSIIAYDLNNIFRNGETSQIAPSEKEKYREKLEIAQQSLSTELVK